MKEGKVEEESDDYEEVEFSDLDTYLKSKPENTVDTSYKIKVVNIPESGVKSSSKTGTLGYILRSNRTKYVSLKFDNSLDNITNSMGMFNRCSSLTSIDTSGFTSITYASGTFNRCSSLTNIDTTSFTSVTDANSMFRNCSLTAYYNSEDDNIYKNYKTHVAGNITWVKKTA